jgi:hypothetical protein
MMQINKTNEYYLWLTAEVVWMAKLPYKNDNIQVGEFGMRTRMRSVRMVD